MMSLFFHQTRFPRSKKRRIRKKWAKRPENYTPSTKFAYAKYFYYLEGKTPKPVRTMADVKRYEQSWEGNRCVKITTFPGAEVSTVFLPLDHGVGQARPLLFETMVFGGTHDQRISRYSTWAEAEAGHDTIAALVAKTEQKESENDEGQETHQGRGSGGRAYSAQVG